MFEESPTTLQSVSEQPKQDVETSMLALVMRGGKPVLRSMPVPALTQPNQVLVQVETAGICRTDIYVARGRIEAADNMTLGHEFSGTVVKCGSAATGWRAGDRVTAHPVLACQDPTPNPDNVERTPRRFLGISTPGVFAEYVCLPAESLFRLPNSLPSLRGAFVEPVAAALAVLKAVAPGQRGIVGGDNRFSRLACEILASAGIEPVTLCAKSQLLELSPSSFDFAIETSTEHETLRALIKALRPGGTLILKSRAPGPIPFPAAAAVAKEITVRAVRYGSFTQAIALLEDGLAVDAFFGPQFPLDEYEQAFEMALKSEDQKLFFRLARPRP